MDNELLRDLLQASRAIYDEAVGEVNAEARAEIDRALREAAIWACEESDRNPSVPMDAICERAEEKATECILKIRALASCKIRMLLFQLQCREKNIRTFVERRERVAAEPNG